MGGGRGEGERSTRDPWWFPSASKKRAASFDFRGDVRASAEEFRAVALGEDQ